MDAKLTDAGYPGVANTYMLYGLKHYQDEADPQGVLGESLDSFLDRELMAYERTSLADKDAHRQENSQVWLTVHNTTYDISNRLFRVAVQEDYTRMFDVGLEGSRMVMADDAPKPYDLIGYAKIVPLAVSRLGAGVRRDSSCGFAHA